MTTIKRIIFPIGVFAALLMFGSCNKYLDVQPVDKFLDDQVYTNEPSIENALNGVYLNLAKAPLYGETLTATTMDVMAQYYNCSFNLNPFYNTANYNYTESNTQNAFGAMWDGNYKAILNLNLFLEKVGATNGILEENKKNIMLGEALGLRAWIAFDLLRVFGPVYQTDSTAISIPYPAAPKGQIEKLLPANVVMDSVLLDIKNAEQLLAKDPVRTAGVQAIGGINNTDQFLQLRNRRMNYFAVQALKARVLLYRGNKEQALTAALSVINEASKWFPWSGDPSSSINGADNPDRSFSSEVIFGLENIDMHDIQVNHFAAVLGINSQRFPNLLAPLPQVLSQVYDNFENDYRLRLNWMVDRTSAITYKTFFKYADIANPTLPFHNFQAMLRISEMYLIAAECEPNEQQAISYLDILHANRGVPPVTGSIDRLDYITREYQKEFWGEGQLFFLYKRLNTPQITSGSDMGSISMTPAEYVVPLPLSETQFR